MSCAEFQVTTTAATRASAIGGTGKRQAGQKVDEAASAGPVRDGELQNLWRRGDPEAFRFSPDDVRARVKKHGDLFSPVLPLKQKLPR